MGHHFNIIKVSRIQIVNHFRQMKQSQGMTEQLKSENALEWVQRMNNIRACAKEIVEKEIIFT